MFSTATCCKLLATARIVTDIRFVSSVGALMYLEEAQAKLCKSPQQNHININVIGICYRGNIVFTQAHSKTHMCTQTHTAALALRWWAVV